MDVKYLWVILPLPLYLLSFWLDHQQQSLFLLTQCLSLTLCIHALVAIPSIYWKSEKFFDITGSIAVLSMLVRTGLAYPVTMRRSVLLFLCACWTVRLGTFLLYRIYKFQNDRRFNTIKTDTHRFLLTWVLSATWTFITLLCALTAICSTQQKALVWLDLLFLAGWICAFLLEGIADWQKLQFKQQPQATPFIRRGVWQYSRHPNYLGEIIMWVCIAGIAMPNLTLRTSICLLSPVFVYYLLTQISGINLLESQNDQRYGHLKSYQQYKRSTPVLWPKIFS